MTKASEFQGKGNFVKKSTQRMPLQDWTRCWQSAELLREWY